MITIMFYFFGVILILALAGLVVLWLMFFAISVILFVVEWTIDRWG